MVLVDDLLAFSFELFEQVHVVLGPILVVPHDGGGDFVDPGDDAPHGEHHRFVDCHGDVLVFLQKFLVDGFDFLLVAEDVGEEVAVLADFVVDEQVLLQFLAVGDYAVAVVVETVVFILPLLQVFQQGAEVRLQLVAVIGNG
jgi:hypothetical protein